MKTFLKGILIVFASSAVSAGATPEQDPFDLSRDVLKTCAIGTEQEKTAEIGLSMAKALFSWHVGDQFSMLHPEFIAWHSALADFLIEYPELIEKVPFKQAQFTKDTLLPTMTFIAFTHARIPYSAELTRVDCIGDDKVVLVGIFDGAIVEREPAKGCITHVEPYRSPIKLIMSLKPSPTNPARRLIHRFDIILNDRVTVEARIRLAEAVKTKPALPPVAESCKTKEKIYEEFASQIK